ncbi:PQQ-binding-like beta-propeller repeat protein [Luteolibacter sp. LG18]|uniref:outer membrane protein assembly factor BamB family protein n=1 Tax=Luteolibacter sp. LG18 TaxID=2819286 RepID=UPI002B2A1AC6|nr:hypothetical protein llg_42350 [Luteolibacter sp. LG18]
MNPKIHHLVTSLALATFVSAEPSTAPDRHDFFYAGEAKTQDMYVVGKGQVLWSYHNPGSRGEISDAVRLSNGRILFAHQYGVTLIDSQTKDNKVLWHHDAPAGCEIHTASPIGTERVVFLQNGPEPKCVVMNITTGQVEREFPLEVGNPKSTHGQFRHAELTTAGTLLVAHMDHGKVSEYDDHGKELWTAKFPGPWAASRLANGNTLVTGTKLVRELNPAGETVWELTTADLPDQGIRSFQIATRLANGNTLVNNWVNSWSETIDPETAPAQALEITPDKKVAWVLRWWKGPNALGPSTTLQLPDSPRIQNFRFGEFH